jgi:hypothetical protein
MAKRRRGKVPSMEARRLQIEWNLLIHQRSNSRSPTEREVLNERIAEVGEKLKRLGAW